MRVKALLNSCIKATPCSARSLTTFTDWAFFWLVLYVSWRSHSLESRLQELFWQAKDLKKSHCRCCDEIVKSLCCRDDKWWVPFGRFLGSFIFFQHQNHQSLLFNWNFIIEKSKSHQQQKDTTRDVPVPSAAMAAFATSFCGYADSEHSMAKSFLGAAVGDWLWNQYLTYTAVTKWHTSCRWFKIWMLKTFSSMISEMWCRHAKFNSSWPISVSNRMQTPHFIPVFEAVVSKHRPLTWFCNRHSFMVSITACEIVAAVPSWSCRIDSSFTTFCPETRIGRRSTCSRPGPAKLSIILSSQCKISGTCGSTTAAVRCTAIVTVKVTTSRCNRCCRSDFQCITCRSCFPLHYTFFL